MTEIEAFPLTVAERLSLFERSFPLFLDIFVEAPVCSLDLQEVLTLDWIYGSSSQLVGGLASHLLAFGIKPDDDNTASIAVTLARLPSSDLDRGLSDLGVLDRSYQPLEVVRRLPAAAGGADRVRSMPQRGSVLAAKSLSSCACVQVFDISSTVEQVEQDSILPLPNLDDGSDRPVASTRLGASSPTPDQLGLAWSPAEAGLLLSTSEGGRVCAYRLDAAAGAAGSSGGAGSRSAIKELEPYAVFAGHSGQLANDIAVAGASDPSLFASAGEDGSVCLWDLRAPASCPAQQWRAHLGRFGAPRAANAVAFSSAAADAAGGRQRLASAGDDGNIKLWDLRGGVGGGGGDQVAPLKVLRSHRCKVLQLAWCPHKAGALASADAKSQVYLWDVDAMAGRGSPPLLPKRPELKYIHSGHAAVVADLAWCPDAALGAMVLATSSALHVGPPAPELGADDGIVSTAPSGREGSGGTAGSERQQEVTLQEDVVQFWRPARDLFA